MAENLVPKAPQLSAAQMAWLQEIGLDKKLLSPLGGPVPKARGGTPVRPGAAPAVSRPSPAREFSSRRAPAQPERAEPANVPPVAPALPDNWNDLKAHIAQCQTCPLHAERHLTVFGSGAEQAASWMVIGEAPGDRDDRYGLPFQGKAGELLQAMFNAVGVGPEVPVFYTNLLKCRPRGSRTPSPAEVAACLPYLQRQIAVVRPARLLILGRLAAQALVDGQAEFEQLRGRVHTFESETGQPIPTVVTYHPASLLSRPQHKAGAWQDINLARSVL